MKTPFCAFTFWLRRAGVVVACLVALTCSSSASAQSSVRGWNRIAFDTEARQGTFVQVAAAIDMTVVRRADGMLFAHGENSLGACDIPAPPPGVTYVDVATGGHSTVALRSDGRLVVGGWFISLPFFSPPPLPAGVQYTSIACGELHVMALRSDGVVDTWGLNTYGQL